MNRQLVSALSLGTLLLACAHDRSTESAAQSDRANARASAETREERAEERAADQTERRKERAERREEHAEQRAEGHDERTEPRAADVDVPRRREKRAELASAGQEIPADKQPDNTGVNERDRGGLGMTPMDQGNSQVDIDMTQRIRKAVMGADLSFTAKNVKIITRDGHVVLRGPVNSAAEKEAIVKLATGSAGVGHVTDQLEVKSD